MVQTSLDYCILYSTEEETQSRKNERNIVILMRSVLSHYIPFVEVLKASKEAEAQVKILSAFKRA